jgi:hypothetical protein
MTSRYRAIIGSLNWAVILGRFNVMYATNTLARFSMAPGLGHLEADKRILGYLQKYSDYRILVNPNRLDMKSAVERFPQYTTWKEYYPEVSEEVPPNMPKPVVGKTTQLTVMVDADHAFVKIGYWNTSFYQLDTCQMVFQDAKDGRDINLRIGICGIQNYYGYCNRVSV